MLEALGTWFAGVVTAGSLLLGLTILRHDRQRQLVEQAKEIAIRADLDNYGVENGQPYYRRKVHLWNRSHKSLSSIHTFAKDFIVR
jgi:hypothetical protein